MQQRLQQLKCNNSLRLEDGIPVIWPKQEKPGKLMPSKVIKSVKNKKAYAFNNAVIAFVSEGELYVTPYTEDSLGVIRDSGYKLHVFFVPFSNGDRPLGEYGEKWQTLVAKIKPFSHQAAPTI